MDQLLTAEQHTSESLLSVANQILAEAPRCFAITNGVDGTINSRIVEPFEREDNWVFWILTSAASRKAAELRASDSLTLSFQNHDASAYVSLIGTARLVSDPAQIAQRWRDGWSRFFSDGAIDRDILLIRFHADSLELYDVGRGIEPTPAGLRSAIIERDGHQWQVTQS